jgi:hypothetical protein
MVGTTAAHTENIFSAWLNLADKFQPHNVGISAKLFEKCEISRRVKVMETSARQQ